MSPTATGVPAQTNHETVRCLLSLSYYTFHHRLSIVPYVSPDQSPLDSAGERRLIMVGGVGLTVLAGYVNVVVLGVFAVPVSHMTGAVSRLGIDLAQRNSADVGLVLLIILGFVCGAILSGTIIGGGRLLPGRRYGVALVAEGIALYTATGLLQAEVLAGVAVAAVACGIQNGMASSYYGLIIRTTHLTGIVTDLGVLIGQRLRGTRVETWKTVLLLSLVGGFLIGGVAGQLMYARQGPTALFVPASVAMICGVAYFLWRQRSVRRSRT